MERLLSFTPLEGTPVQAWFDAMSRYFSPYDVNPLNINPLKDLFEKFVDFEALRANADLQIFISATNVQTGRVRIFPREKITADAVMASATAWAVVLSGSSFTAAVPVARFTRQSSTPATASAAF